MFQSVKTCPACESGSETLLGKLPGKAYEVGIERIRYPDGGIPLMRCTSCELVYKGTVPTKEFLRDVFSKQAKRYWLNVETFDVVASQLGSMFGKRFDLMDVGAWSGSLLAACAGAEGRRSGLDIVRHPTIDRTLRGEFIQGFIEDAALSWSKEPYDVVTLFDVLEHLYEPPKAFNNLEALIRPSGAAVIETGNIDVVDESQAWWYTRLFEHHMFWNPVSVRHMAAKHGFVVEQCERVQHKATGESLIPRAWRLFKAGLCWNGHRVWKSKIALFLLQRNANVVGNADHLRIVLRRSPA